MAGASWPFTTYYPVVYVIGADGSNAASATNGLPITFTTLALGNVTFSTAVLGQVLPANSGVSSSIGSFTASAMSVVGSSTTRKFVVFQADATTQAWIAFGTAAVSGAPAIRIASNTAFRLDGNFVPRDSITLYCQSFVSYTFIEG